MRRRASSWSADVGKMTIEHKIINTQERVTRRWSLTFIASIEFRFADEGGTVDLVTSQEHISGVGVASSNI